MKYKLFCAWIAVSIISVGAISAYAEENQSTKDENTVVGACMVQKFSERTPPVTKDNIAKCGNAEASTAPKCLGLTDQEYTSFAKFCVNQLINAKCVAAKIKVPLIQYADCGYENDPVACYKNLGFSMDDIVKISTDCQKETAVN